MAEPGLNSAEAARFYERGPSFADLAKGMTPDEKHRYTQWRAAQQQRDFSPTKDPEVMRKRGQESRDLLAMFTKPGSDEDVLFKMLDDSETDTEVESDAPLGKQYGSEYASQKAAAARKSPQAATQPPRSTAPQQGYTDLNSRLVGISERTFMPDLQAAAKRKLKRK